MSEMEELLARHRNEQMELLAKHKIQREDVMQQSSLKKTTGSGKQTNRNPVSKSNEGDEMADKSQKIDGDCKIDDESHKPQETGNNHQCDQDNLIIKKTKKRNPKIPGTRAHRKTKEYAEGRDILPEIKIFFLDKFEDCEGNRVFCSDLLSLFKQYRIDNGKIELSSLQEELFWRHGKKIFLEQFPKCRFTAYKHQRCYLGVRLK
jgi:ssDNA-binding Zn-finger/Zn-ribbon topoisomerase 1